MIKLMKEPHWLEKQNWHDKKFTISYLNSDQIIRKFKCFDNSHDYLNIPSELEKKNWKPEKGKTYACWWYNTKPGDSLDLGENILVYIEEFENSCDENASSITNVLKPKTIKSPIIIDSNKNYDDLIVRVQTALLGEALYCEKKVEAAGKSKDSDGYYERKAREYKDLVIALDELRMKPLIKI